VLEKGVEANNRPKREEVTEGFRKQHDEELRDLYHSQSISVIKSRRMTWMQYVAHMEEMKNSWKIFFKSER
jgi:hypothetical protein